MLRRDYAGARGSQAEAAALHAVRRAVHAHSALTGGGTARADSACHEDRHSTAHVLGREAAACCGEAVQSRAGELAVLHLTLHVPGE